MRVINRKDGNIYMFYADRAPVSGEPLAVYAYSDENAPGPVYPTRVDAIKAAIRLFNCNNTKAKLAWAKREDEVDAQRRRNLAITGFDYIGDKVIS